MSPWRREKMLMLNNGDINHQVNHILRIIDGHRRCDEVLAWCLRSGLTGDNIVEMVRYQFGFSPLTFLKWVLSKIDKENELRPVLVGKDWDNK